MLRAERIERITKHQQQQQHDYDYDEIAIEIDVNVDTESSLQQQVADLLIAFADTEYTTLRLLSPPDDANMFLPRRYQYGIGK